jgi:hypothetical protein
LIKLPSINGEYDTIYSPKPRASGISGDQVRPGSRLPRVVRIKPVFGTEWG